MNKIHQENSKIENIAARSTRWIGSTSSLLVHTILFVITLGLVFFNIDVEKILLVLTTAVSLEAIYLAIFIQMSVNKNTASIVSIQEDVAEIEEDIDEIAEDVEDIVEDVDEIAEDRFRENIKSTKEHESDKASFERIEKTLLSIIDELNQVREKRNESIKQTPSKRILKSGIKKIAKKVRSNLQSTS